VRGVGMGSGGVKGATVGQAMSTVGDIATPTPCRGRGRPVDTHAGRGRRDGPSRQAGPEGWPAACAFGHRPARGATGTPLRAGRVRGLELLFPGTTVG
jgi:hypothetical protein